MRIPKTVFESSGSSVTASSSSESASGARAVTKVVRGWHVEEVVVGAQPSTQTFSLADGVGRESSDQRQARSEAEVPSAQGPCSHTRVEAKKAELDAAEAEQERTARAAKFGTSGASGRRKARERAGAGAQTVPRQVRRQARSPVWGVGRGLVSLLEARAGRLRPRLHQSSRRGTRTGQRAASKFSAVPKVP